MIIWQFISIYVADVLAEYIYASTKSSILFAAVYIGSFAMLNGHESARNYEEQVGG